MIAILIIFILTLLIAGLIFDDFIQRAELAVTVVLVIIIVAQLSIKEIDGENSFEIDNIYTLEDSQYKHSNETVSGNFLFVYGKTITEEGMNYVTMVGNETEGYLIKTFDASKVYLFMDGNELPYIKYNYKNIKIQSNWFARLLGYEDDNYKKLIKIELHIPKEAVVVSYNVDLE